MNILYINSFDCSPASSGGVNRLVLILSDFLRKHYGYHCYLGYFMDNHSEYQQAEFEGRIKLNDKVEESVFKQFLVQNNIQIVQINFLIKSLFANIPIIYRVAKKLNIPVIYGFHMNPGYQLQTFGSIDKVLYSIKTHNKYFTDIKDLLLTWLYPIADFLAPIIIRKKYLMPYDNCDKIVVSCIDYAKEYSRIICNSDTKSKYAVIGNMLSTDSPISEEDFRGKKKEVIVIARFDDKMKRVSLALKIWRLIEQNEKLKDWKLTIIGDGVDKGFYYFLIAKYKLQRVEFVGEQTPWEYYKRASIVMMASGAEGWPMVLMGTMPMGVVPVVFDSFDALHVIINHNKNGILVPNGNISLFSKMLTKLMLDTEYRFQLGTNAVKDCQQFKVEEISKKWYDLYCSLTRSF